MPHRVDPIVTAQDRTGPLTEALLREPKLRFVRQARTADLDVADDAVTVWFGSDAVSRSAIAIALAVAAAVVAFAVVGYSTGDAQQTVPETTSSSNAAAALLGGAILVALGGWGARHLLAHRIITTRIDIDHQRIRMHCKQAGEQLIETARLDEVTVIRFAEVHSEDGTTYGADLLVNDQTHGARTVILPRSPGTLEVVRSVSWFRPDLPIEVVAIQHLHSHHERTARDWLAALAALVGVGGPIVLLIGVVQALGLG